MRGRPPLPTPRLSHLRGGVEHPAVCCVVSAPQAPGWSLIHFPADLVLFQKLSFSSACSSQMCPGRGLGYVLHGTVNLCKESQQHGHPACSPWNPGTGWSQCDPATDPVPPSGLRVAPISPYMEPRQVAEHSQAQGTPMPCRPHQSAPTQSSHFSSDSSDPGRLPPPSSLGRSLVLKAQHDVWVDLLVSSCGALGKSLSSLCLSFPLSELGEHRHLEEVLGDER